eukprot:CAMPEP_0194709712 /NCGR_PEP_ID=MMETSP0296-20130528/2457_1 /TAXON_ID=39354 /ORGANISM="Heterosigma akashiwo, Strain CCMP2393" /LENGTH=448 /DNA_ID=CAMNT_0039607127 /DNA_START=368 /DNA_END=1714 /DNA_ORIENTATION=+
MNANMEVPITVIAEFAKIRALTREPDVIRAALEGSKVCIVTEDAIKPNFKTERNTIILREIPSNTPEEKVREIFTGEGMAPITNIRSDVGDTWFVTLGSEAAAVAACLALRERAFEGRPVKARLKSENLLRAFYPVPQAAADAPLPPPPWGGQGPYLADTEACRFEEPSQLLTARNVMLGAAGIAALLTTFSLTYLILRKSKKAKATSKDATSTTFDSLPRCHSSLKWGRSGSGIAPAEITATVAPAEGGRLRPTSSVLEPKTSTKAAPKKAALFGLSQAAAGRRRGEHRQRSSLQQQVVGPAPPLPPRETSKPTAPPLKPAQEEEPAPPGVADSPAQARSGSGGGQSVGLAGRPPALPRRRLSWAGEPGEAMRRRSSRSLASVGSGLAAAVRRRRGSGYSSLASWSDGEGKDSGEKDDEEDALRPIDLDIGDNNFGMAANSEGGFSI